MRRIFVAICIIFSCVAYADTTITSKNYVDNQIATKQDIVPAKDTNTVLTHTGESGNIGEKEIYDANGDYLTQQHALVTAGVADAAIQNAIDTEFVCVEWYENDEHTDENCLGWKIQNTTQYPSSKNLFNLDNARILYSSNSQIQTTKNSNGYTVMVPGNITGGYYFIMVELGDVNEFLGKTLTISVKSNCINGGKRAYGIGRCNNTCSQRSGGNATYTMPTSINNSSLTKAAFWLYANAGGAGTNPGCTYYDIQVEEGTAATAYEPYQNLYIPQYE